MKVKVAKHAGFCMGVDLALKKLDFALLKNTDKIIVTLGPIIHNPQVLREYQDKGVRIIENVEEIEANMSVIIRAHGISKSDEAKAREKAFEVIDATCPKVKTAQIAVEKATKQAKDSTLLLYGEESHPEVRGLVSYSAIPYKVFADPREIYDSISAFSPNFILAAQTTQDIEVFNTFSSQIQSLKQGEVEILNTICNATRERQEAVRELVDEVDAFIVIGGRTSGNTRRLAEIASSYKRPTYHIETLSELKNEKFQKNFVFALTAGASTPKRYIEEVKNFLEQKEEVKEKN